MWVYGFNPGLIVSQDGIITRFGLAEARAYALPARVKDDATCLADKMGTAGALVIATPGRKDKRACRWSAGKRQVVEQVVSYRKDLFSPERHRARTLSGLLARIAARILAHTIWLSAARCVDRLICSSNYTSDVLGTYRVEARYVSAAAGPGPWGQVGTVTVMWLPARITG